MDYGKTLNLPETEFPMRAGLPEREPGVLEYWQDNKIYEKKRLLGMRALLMVTVKFTWELL